MLSGTSFSLDASTSASCDPASAALASTSPVSLAKHSSPPAWSPYAPDKEPEAATEPSLDKNMAKRTGGKDDRATSAHDTHDGTERHPVASSRNEYWTVRLQHSARGSSSTFSLEPIQLAARIASDNLGRRAEVVRYQIPANTRLAIDSDTSQASSEHRQDELHPTPELLRGAVELRATCLQLEGRSMPVGHSQLGVQLHHFSASRKQTETSSFASPPPRGRALRPGATKNFRITCSGDPARTIFKTTNRQAASSSSSSRGKHRHASLSTGAVARCCA
ncbi:unnamed protein product, partial [Prorocentrum cordatum]